VIYVFGLKAVKKTIGDRQDRDDTYEDCCAKFAMYGKHATYFNTNPIFVLRAKYLDDKHAGLDKDHCIPWALGKEHWHPGAPTTVLPRPSALQAIFCFGPTISEGAASKAGSSAGNAAAGASTRETAGLTENRAPAPSRAAAASSTATGARNPQREVRQRTGAASAAKASAAQAPKPDPEATGGDEELKF